MYLNISCSQAVLLMSVELSHSAEETFLSNDGGQAFQANT